MGNIELKNKPTVLYSGSFLLFSTTFYWKSAVKEQEDGESQPMSAIQFSSC
jgi:hypothetical protein